MDSRIVNKNRKHLLAEGKQYRALSSLATLLKADGIYCFEPNLLALFGQKRRESYLLLKSTVMVHQSLFLAGEGAKNINTMIGRWRKGKDFQRGASGTTEKITRHDDVALSANELRLQGDDDLATSFWSMLKTYQHSEVLKDKMMTMFTSKILYDTPFLAFPVDDFMIMEKELRKYKAHWRGSERQALVRLGYDSERHIYTLSYWNHTHDAETEFRMGNVLKHERFGFFPLVFNDESLLIIHHTLKLTPVDYIVFYPYLDGLFIEYWWEGTVVGKIKVTVSKEDEYKTASQFTNCDKKREDAKETPSASDYF